MEGKVYLVWNYIENDGSYEDYEEYEDLKEVCTDFETAKQVVDEVFEEARKDARHENFEETNFSKYNTAIYERGYGYTNYWEWRGCVFVEECNLNERYSR